MPPPNITGLLRERKTVEKLLWAESALSNRI